MKKRGQMASMFGASDLPLFSGTAPKVVSDTFAPEAETAQTGMFAYACPICKDTGKVDNRPCICGQHKEV